MYNYIYIYIYIYIHKTNSRGDLRWVVVTGKSGASVDLTTFHLTSLRKYVANAFSLFLDMTSSDYERQLRSSFQRYVDAVVNVVFKTDCTLFVVLASAVVVHVLGCTVFHFIKTRQMTSASSSSPSSSDDDVVVAMRSTCSQSNNVHHHRHCENDDDDDQLTQQQQQRNSDCSESDDNDVSFKPTTTTTTQSMATTTNALLLDFRYSETKV